MREIKKIKKFLFLWFFFIGIVQGIFLFQAFSCGGEQIEFVSYSKNFLLAMKTLYKARKSLGLPRGDSRFLIITNAGFGKIANETSEKFIDIAYSVTGCSIGKGNLLTVRTSMEKPLWFALIRKDTGDAVFAKWTGKGFKTITFNVKSKKLLTLSGWKKLTSGILDSGTLFSIASITLGYLNGASYELIKSAEFHGHICPGLISGVWAAQLVKKNLKLGKGESYIFIGAPPKCALDAWQTIFISAGRGGLYALYTTIKEKGKISPLPTKVGIALKVNRSAKYVEGILIGIDWDKFFQESGVKAEEFAPPEGKKNPLFFISRIKVMLAMLKEKNPPVKVLKEIVGPISIIRQLTEKDVYGEVEKL